MHSCVPAQPGSVPALSLPSALHFNNKNESQARESHFHPGSHLCISESTSSVSASHIRTIHRGKGHHVNSDFQYDSCWLFSRLWVSLALETPNQINSCSCRRFSTSPRHLGCSCNHGWKLERLQNGAVSLSLSRNTESVPHAGWGCGGQGGYHLRYKTTPSHVLPIHSPLPALFCHSTKCLNGTFKIQELNK